MAELEPEAGQKEALGLPDSAAAWRVLELLLVAVGDLLPEPERVAE